MLLQLKEEHGKEEEILIERWKDWDPINNYKSNPMPEEIPEEIHHNIEKLEKHLGQYPII